MTTENKPNYFCELNAVNVSEKIEKKNGLSYLSWAFAWAELKKRYPNSFYTIYEDGNGCIYWTDGRTCWVKTGVTVVFEDANSVEHIEYLPVMDFKNRSIPLESVTSFDVNKAIQRSLTKACARHGLGLYIYAGEDLPEEETTKETEEDIQKQREVYIKAIQTLLAATKVTEEQLVTACDEKCKETATKIEQLSTNALIYANRILTAKKEKMQKEG